VCSSDLFGQLDMPLSIKASLFNNDKYIKNNKTMVFNA